MALNLRSLNTLVAAIVYTTLGLMVLVVVGMMVGLFTGHINPAELGTVGGAMAGGGLAGFVVVFAYIIRTALGASGKSSDQDSTPK